MPTYTIRDLHALEPDDYPEPLFDIVQQLDEAASYSEHVYDTLAEAEAAKRGFEAGEDFVGEPLLGGYSA